MHLSVSEGTEKQVSLRPVSQANWRAVTGLQVSDPHGIRRRAELLPGALRLREMIGAPLRSSWKRR